MDKTENSKKRPEGETIEGIVTARKCDCCGHHELGVVRVSGEFVPLRSGMRVVVINR